MVCTCAEKMNNCNKCKRVATKRKVDEVVLNNLKQNEDTDNGSSNSSSNDKNEPLPAASQQVKKEVKMLFEPENGAKFFLAPGQRKSSKIWFALDNSQSNEKTVKLTCGTGKVPNGISIFLEKPSLMIPPNDSFVMWRHRDEVCLNFSASLNANHHEEVSFVVKPILQKIGNAFGAVIQAHKIEERPDILMEIFPDYIHCRLKPGQSKETNFGLRNDCDTDLTLLCGTGNLPDGVSLFFKETSFKMSAHSRNNNLKFTVVLEDEHNKDVCFEIKPQLILEPREPKLILFATQVDDEHKVMSAEDAKGLVLSSKDYVVIDTKTHKNDDPQNEFKLTHVMKRDVEFSQLKLAMQHALNMPFTRIRLIYQGKQLEDGKTPHDYNLPTRCQMYAQECLCGC